MKNLLRTDLPLMTQELDDIELCAPAMPKVFGISANIKNVNSALSIKFNKTNLAAKRAELFALLAFFSVVHVLYMRCNVIAV